MMYVSKTAGGIGLAIVVISGLLGYVLTDVTYYCDVEPGKLLECPWGISGGAGTRCYLNEQKNRWDSCSSGWKRAFDFVARYSPPDPVNAQKSIDGDAVMELSFPFARVASNDGDTLDIAYGFSKSGDSYVVRVCPKTVRSSFSALPVTKLQGFASVSKSSLDAKSCTEFRIEGADVGDRVKVGSASTIIEIAEGNVTFRVTPEHTTCSFLSCESDIILQNAGSYDIDINTDDIVCSVEGSVSSHLTFKQYPFLVNQTSYACENLSCFPNGTETVMQYRDVDASESRNYTLQSGSSASFVLRSIQETPERQYKYNCSFWFQDVEYMIDPFFNTTGTGFNNGTYTFTILNESGFVQLGPEEFPDNKTIANGLNMTGNVLLFHFNNNSAFGENNTRVYDFSGNGNNGTNFNGPLPISTGKLQGGYDYDAGNDEYTDVTDSNTLDFNLTQSFSLAFWMKNTDKSNYKHIVSKATYGASPRGYRTLIQQTSGNVTFTIMDGVGNLPAVTTNTIPSDGLWHHIVGVRDVASDKIYIYLDGVLAASTTDTTTATLENSNALRIGNNQEGQGSLRAYDGFIDEVALWNRSLSANEILSIYQAQVGQFFNNGSYESEVFDSGQSSEWKNITWAQETCYGCELPSNQVLESGNYITPVNMTGNILLYHFNNDSSYAENNTHVYDFSGNGKNGTAINGALPTPNGEFGGGFLFDGSNDFINVSTPLSTSVITTLTYGGWFYPREITPTFGDIILNGGNANGNRNFNLALPADRAILCGRSNDWAISAGSLVTLNAWNHIMCTDDNDIIRIYLNGVLVKTHDYGAVTPNAPITVNIGRYINPAEPNYQFNGSMDEVAIWNRTLSATEIRAIYERGAVRLNASVRSCDDALCSGETYTSVANPSPQNLSIPSNRYFQYLFNFSTTDTNVTPRLYNVSIGYDSSSVSGVCSCPGINTNFVVDFANFCFFNTVCDLGTGNLSFTGTGNASINATFNVSSIISLSENGTVWLYPNGMVLINGRGG